MTLSILAQTDGQSWKVDANQRIIESSGLDDSDEEMSSTQAKKTIHLTDQEILEEEYGRAETLIQKLRQDVGEMEVNLK